MNDERFFDLAMKVIARQSTDGERAELDACLANQPQRLAEFKQLNAEPRLAKEVLPLIAATESTEGKCPAYARERLQTKVRQTLGRPEAVQRVAASRWRWWPGLAATAALIVLSVILLSTKTPQPVVQVAMLDITGATRGAGTNELAVLQERWKEASVDTLGNTNDLQVWETSWPNETKRPAVKVIYDRSAGEVRVSGRWKGKMFQKSFAVEKDLATAVAQADEFIRQQMPR
ncbi:MAG: hypothetical protein ABI651_21340 [Verrucomicrobiota bacterium]